VVFGRNWKEMVYKYDLHHGYVVEFMIHIKMIIFRADCSTAMLYTYPDQG
jgi:hypothetical protein